MAEALISCNTLVLEKKWITHGPKSVAFAQLLSKTEIIFKNYSKKDGGSGSKGGKFNKGKKPDGNKKYELKFNAPK